MRFDLTFLQIRGELAPQNKLKRKTGVKEETCRPLGKMADSRSGPASTQNEPGASPSARK